MFCKLCLETGEELISFSNVECKISKIIYKYFSFCFEGESSDGNICQKCLLKVELFHDFYILIKEIHSTLYKNENIFAECITEQVDIKINSEETLTETIPLKTECDNIGAADEPNLFDVENDSDDSDYKPYYETLSKKQSIRKARQEEPSDKKNVSADKKKRKRNKGLKFERFKCDFCNTHFLVEGHLQRHVKKIHLALEFKCVERKCIDSFDTAEQLNKHINENHARQECLHCNKIIGTALMPRHIKLKHECAHLHVVCDLCGKVSDSKSLHKLHVQSEHDVIHQKVQCDICGLWLKHKGTLRSHMSVRHIQGPQTCPTCGKVSPNRKALTKHLEIHIADTKDQFKCIVCGKGFRHSTKLKEHSYIHSGVTDAYRCNYCNKAFRFSSSMYAHRKKEHPVEEQCRINNASSC